MQDYDLQYEKYIASQEARLQLQEMWEQQQDDEADRRYTAMERREKDPNDPIN